MRGIRLFVYTPTNEAAGARAGAGTISSSQRKMKRPPSSPSPTSAHHMSLTLVSVSIDMASRIDLFTAGSSSLFTSLSRCSILYLCAHYAGI